MTVILELPTELEDELAQEATSLGLSLPDYTLYLLQTRPLLGKPPRTGAELVAYWQDAGVIGMRKDIVDSQAHARQLRRSAVSHSLGLLDSLIAACAVGLSATLCTFRLM